MPAALSLSLTTSTKSTLGPVKIASMLTSSQHAILQELFDEDTDTREVTDNGCSDEENAKPTRRKQKDISLYDLGTTLGLVRLQIDCNNGAQKIKKHVHVLCVREGERVCDAQQPQPSRPDRILQ